MATSPQSQRKRNYAMSQIANKATPRRSTEAARAVKPKGAAQQPTRRTDGRKARLSKENPNGWLVRAAIKASLAAQNVRVTEILLLGALAACASGLGYQQIAIAQLNLNQLDLVEKQELVLNALTIQTEAIQAIVESGIQTSNRNVGAGNI